MAAHPRFDHYKEGRAHEARTPEDLIACWTLVGDDWALVGNKTGATRLGFALLKYFELDARFLRYARDVPRGRVREYGLDLVA